MARWIMPSTAVLGPKIVPRLTGPLIEKTDLRLNLGCGPMHLDGYVNIDSSPSASADVYMDFSELKSAFAATSVSEILMIHSLSYLNLWEARAFFRVAHRLLQTDGKLVLELPSIEKCSEHLLQAKNHFDAYLEGVRGIYAFDPSEIQNRTTYTPYAFGWSEWHLERELRAAGYTRFEVLSPKFHEQPWRDFRMEATK
jgi:hypothetical protein